MKRLPADVEVEPMADAPDLAAWLIEQIAEDETDVADARRALVHRVAFAIGKARGETEHTMAGPVFTTLCREAEVVVASADHLDVFGRVLAECDAKRRIVERHVPRLVMPGVPICGHCSVPDAVDWPCADVRGITSVYADRPGYRQEWAP